MYAAQPFIDFHVNNSSDDYTYRILASNVENVLLFQGRYGATIDKFRFLGDIDLPSSSMRVGGHITCDMNVTASNGTFTGRIGKFTDQMLIGSKGENAVTVNKDEEGHAIALKWKRTGVSDQSGLYVFIDGESEYGPIITNNR